MPTNVTSLQSTRWCFTLNNYTDAEHAAVSDLLSGDSVKYAVVGREGTDRTPHLQGFIVFKSNKRFNAVRSLLPRAHIEPTRAKSVVAAEYCKKELDFDEYGSIGHQGERTDLKELIAWGDQFCVEHGYPATEGDVAQAYPEAVVKFPRLVHLFELRAPTPILRPADSDLHSWQSAVLDEVMEEADDRKIKFFVDYEGGKGKTFLQQMMVSHRPDQVQCLGVCKRDDMAHMVDVRKSVFCINVPRGTMSHLQYPILEMLKDRMICSPKYNSTMKILRQVPHVLVFCNEDPDMDKMSMDRYDIVTLN